MKNFRKVMFSLLFVFCATLGLFTGCGDPLANLKVSLNGDSLVLQDDVYHLTLVKDTDNPDLSSAYITAEVEGVQGDLLSAVEWSYDKNFLSIEYENSDKTEVTLTAINPTKVGTVVTVYSVETKKAFCQIVVDIMVKPVSASAKADLSQFGIPIGQDYKLNPADLFQFEPINSTVPDYTFELNGRKFATDEVFKVASKPASGTINIKAYPTNKGDYSEEVFEALTVTLDNVRAYYALNNENTTISLYGSMSELENLELVKNTINNNITLNVNAPNDESIEISVVDTNNIVDNYVWVKTNNEAKTIMFTGLRELNQWTEISFKIKVAGVSDAVEVQKTIKVRVVDVPDKVVLNGDNSNDDYELRVFDRYKATDTESLQGTKLTLNLSPYSKIYNKIKLTVDTSAASNQALANSLLINGVPFVGEYETVADTTIYLKNSGGYGTLILNVIASDTETMENQDVVSRKLVLHMEQGVTGILVGSEYLDSVSQALVLQRDMIGYQNSYQTKRLRFSVLPEDASADTVTVRSLDPSIATVQQDTANKDIIYINAVSAGNTKIIFEAESGVTHELDVRVLTVLNEATINIDSRTDSVKLGEISTKNVTVGSNNVQTLNYAFVANNSLINLNHNIYPASAESVISDITITPDAENIATAYPKDKTNILLTTFTRGEVTFTMNINYYALRDGGESRGVNIVTVSKKLQFSIKVFVPIERIEVNKTNVELLAPTSSVNTSFYDIKNNSADLTVSIYPANSEVQASSAVWAKSPASTTKLTLSNTTGSAITINAQMLTSLEDRINVTVVVTIKDINNLVYTKQIAVSITKIKRISNIYIDEYGDQNASGLYFDYYKQDEKFDLNLTILPSNATNKNVEYLIFDAVKIDSIADATVRNNVIRLDSGRRDDRNRVIYDYYEVKTRNETDNPSSRVCKTAMVDIDSETGVYSIKQISAGYAFLYIIPQDILDTDVETITGLTTQLQNVSDTSSIRRIPITIADGKDVRYRLRTAEDVASISKTDYGLSSNYYLMNTIDMSNYLAKNPNWTAIGTLAKPFSGSIISAGCDTGTGVAQSIVGWSLSKTYNERDPNRDSNYTLYYGIFGVVTGEIKYINFSINNYQITQTTRRTNIVSGDEYDFGALVGRLITSEGNTAEISNVNVTVSNFVYSLNKAYSDTFDMSVNLGAIGLIDANSVVTNLSVKINAQISSDDLKINFGAIAGRNKGTIGASHDTTYTNFATSNVVIKNAVAGKLDNLSAESNIGIAVGKNYAYKLGTSNVDLYGQVYGVACDGSIVLGTESVNVGGVVAYNLGVIGNCMSSAKLNANGNVGGIAGYNTNEIEDTAYEIYSTTNSNCGISSTGNVGGIVGLNNGGNIKWAMVLGYDINEEIPNIIVGSQSRLGGLIGLNRGTAQIEFSFANASLKVNGVLGGLVGQNAGTLVIKNSYARGILQNDDTTGAIIGNVDSGTVNINAVYAEFSEDFAVSGSGTVITSAYKTIILVKNPANFTTETNLIYLDKTSADASSLNYFRSNGFVVASTGVAGWISKVGTNDNFIYLQKEDGTEFIRVIPNAISITAKTFETFTDGLINNTLNVTNSDNTIDSKKLIIMYQKNMEAIKLSNLFNFASEPTIDVENVRMNVTCSSNNVIQLISGVNFNDYYLKVVGTGTVVIKFVSVQNTSANDTIQIAVINGFNNFNLYEGADASGTLIENGATPYELKIKNGGTNQAFVNYVFNGNVQESVDGGLRFSVSDNSIFSMSVEGWQAGENEYYYYLSGQDRITLKALQYGTDLAVKVTPFITATFYTLNENGQISGSQKLVFDILDNEMALNYNTSIYKGASSIAMGIADKTSIYAGDALTSAVTLFTDNYTVGDDVFKHIGYTVIRTDTGENIIDTSTDKSTDIMTVKFGEMEYNDLYDSLAIPFSIYLNEQYRKTLSEKTDYTIKFFALDLNGNMIDDMVATLDWSFIPQKINHIDMAHYSDAVNTGAKLQQAGELPTNTIIAGQFGLMKINVSPDYAYYDYIDITSGVTNGETMMFDQRVLSMENGIANYYSWQRGVEIIENGIRLYRVSNLDGSFDGTYYIRTLVSELQPANAIFTAYVTIYQGETTYTNQLSMTVHLPDNLSISYANYNDNLGYAYVAKGTGYTIGKNIPTQNQNELILNVGTTYSDISVTTSSTKASIVEENGRYYLNTGTAEVGEYITVTLTGKQNLSGLVNEISREMTFLVVDFYINSISQGLVNGSNLGTNFRFAYVKDKKYDLRIFEGATLENLGTISAITFDTTNDLVKAKIMQVINSLNGIGDEVYSGWSAYVTQSNGTVIAKQLNTLTTDLGSSDEQKNWINGNYCYYNAGAGYQIEANGVSSNSRIKYDIAFTFNNGLFALVPFDELTNACRGYYTDDITLDFYQITSQEHAQPIYSEKDLTAMESGIDYILMNDIEITSVWTPITTEISSLNGNGYTIRFIPADITSTTGNFGLFDTITANMVVKNIKLQLANKNITIATNVSGLSTLRVGLIAGVNEGTVHNCEVVGLDSALIRGVTVASPQDTTADFAIAGLIGENTSNGAVSNSRVNYLDITAFGKIAGLVALNSGNISACYYTGGNITNIANTTGDNVATAGLVVENSNNGTIYGSYTGGAYTEIVDNQNTILTSLANSRNGIIQSGVRASGFVYSNLGKISDSYSAMQIIALESSGFAFTNGNAGVISRCYSVCLMSNAETGVTSVSMPFIGVDGITAGENNNRNPNGIVNCYFYDTGFSASALRLEEAKALSLEQFMGTKGTSVFDNFTFSRTNEAGGEFTGIWVFVDENNLYFTPERFETKLSFEGYSGNVPQMNFGPKLVSADLIATSRMYMLDNPEVDPDTGAVKYSYGKKFNSYFEKITNNDFGTDYSYDPVAITTATQFNNAFNTALDGVTAVFGTEEVLVGGVKTTQSVTKIIDDIRLARNLDQSEIDINTTLYSPTQNYAGIFEGNGFTFSNLNLAINETNVDRYGLFGAISRVNASETTQINHIGTVKNLNVAVTAVSCSQVSFVGAVAGVVDSGNLYNITVSGAQARVIGNNAVGGVVGLAKGTTRASEISANVGVTVNYKRDTNKLYNYDLLRTRGSAYTANDTAILGYAGGVFGIADLTQFDTVRTTTNANEAMLNNIKSTGQASIVGKIVGGVAGLLGVDTVLNNATKIIDSQTAIKGYTFAGGLVGQNNGVIRYGSVKYTDEIQSVEDIANTGEDRVTDLAGQQISINSTAFESGADTIGTGGLVGLNVGSTSSGWIGGTIYYGSSKVRVRNSNSTNVGGIVGVAYGGDIRAVFATGGVLGARVANLGGIVGYVSDFDNTSDILVNNNSLTNPFGERVRVTTTLDYCVALNNYLVADYNYYLNIKNRIDAYHGGLVGYCHDAGQIYTTHTVATGEDTPFSNLTNSINYYVGKIFNKVVLNTVTTSIADLTPNETDIDLKAVGGFGTGSGEPATAQTRGYMLSHLDEIFSGWDSYSIDNSNGMPEIERKDIPDVMQIRTIADYLQMYWHPDKTFILMNDLDFKGANVASVPIGSESAPFTGTFNGNGYTIYNMPIVQTSTANTGMFGATDGATITKVNLVNLYISTNLSEEINAYVGGLVGVARNTTVSQVNIKCEAGENTYHEITTNANFVGGMFGRIYTTENNESNISDCYAYINLNLTDNRFGTKNTNAYLGGFAGLTQGNVVLKNIYTEGSLKLACSSNANSKVTHIIGGLIGSATETNIDTAISDVNIDIDNIYLALYAGGMFGMSIEIDAVKVDSAGDLNLALNNLTAVNVFNVGGLSGKSNADSITGVIVSGDITLNGTYGVSENTTVNEQIHALGGVVGVGSGQSIASGYSIATIKNNTRFENIDLSIYSGDIRSSATIWCDSYLGLTAKDKLGVGRKSTEILNSFSASNFTRPATNNYARLNVTDFATFNPSNERYKALYQGENVAGDRKTSPLIIANASDFRDKINTSAYKYYIQTSASISGIDINANKQILGWYNGAGNIISAQSVDTLDYSEFTPSTTLNYGIFGETNEQNGKGSVISGVVLRMNFTSKIAPDSNFAGIVSVLSENSKLFGCYATINAQIGLASGNATVGGLVAINKGQIIGCASNVNISLYGEVDSQGNLTSNAGSIIAGGMVGWSQNVDTRLTLMDSYAVGTIKNYNTNNTTSIGGLVGKVATSSNASLGFYNKNCYVSVNIVDNGNAVINPVVAVRNGGATNNSGIYYDLNATNVTPTDWENFTIPSLREGATLDLGTAFETKQNKNYGLPYLKLLSSANILQDAQDTGEGTVNNPYKINSAGQLQWALTSGKTAYFILNSNIDFNYIARNFVATTFAGNLNGNGYEIKNISKTLATNISGSVSKVKLTPIAGLASDILANNISGSASEILVNTTSGVVNTSGKIENSMSFGATFNGTTTNCFTDFPTDFTGLDSSIWGYTGRKVNNVPVYELLAFVEEIGENAKFGVSVTFVENAYLINTAEQFDRIVSYLNVNGSVNAIKFNGDTISLGNKMLKTLKNSNLSLIGTRVTDGLIYRDNANLDFTATSGNNTINSISNCGVVINGNASVFGAGSAKFADNTTFNIKNVIVRANANSALVLGAIDRIGTLNVNMENVTIDANENVEFYALANSVNAKTVNLTLSNVVMNNVSGITKTNTGVINLTTLNSTLNGGSEAKLFVSNSGTINVKNSLNTTITGKDNVSGIVGTNSGTITITTGDLTVTGESNVAGIANTNASDGKIEIQNFTISATATNGNASGISIANAGSIAGTNANSAINLTIESSVIATGIAGENTGTIENLTISNTVSGLTASGIANTNTGSISGVIINALNVTGDNATTIASENSGNVDVTIAQNVNLSASNTAGGLFISNQETTDKTISIKLNAVIDIASDGTVGALCVNGTVDESNITVTNGSITLNGTTKLFPSATEPTNP